MRREEILGGGLILNSSRSSSSPSSSSSRRIRCQECGNRAKRECEYSRCRTCCKSGGFHCQTHVKSTWVPIPLRSKFAMNNNNPLMHHHHGSEDSSSFQRRRRISQPDHHHQQQQHTSYLNPTSTANAIIPPPAGLEERKFPGEVRLPEVVFRCVRVRSMDSNVVDADEYAYQASVSIGGHLFTGILYHQGPAAAP